MKYLLIFLLLPCLQAVAISKKEAIFLKCMERYVICRNQQVGHDLDKPKSVICTESDIEKCMRGKK